LPADGIFRQTRPDELVVPLVIVIDPLLIVTVAPLTLLALQRTVKQTWHPQHGVLPDVVQFPSPQGGVIQPEPRRERRERVSAPTPSAMVRRRGELDLQPLRRLDGRVWEGGLADCGMS
jgi:hypothetical protein